MKPPICAICGKYFRVNKEDGGLVIFKLSNDELAVNKRLAESYRVGHPAGQEWFCSEHIIAARKLMHLTFKEAMIQLKSDQSNTDR